MRHEMKIFDDDAYRQASPRVLPPIDDDDAAYAAALAYFEVK